ncbi:phage Gp37/Gp68 family protein [Streptomyces akebiae]|uniref:phage Gp37/Gp68 family protein n=1 Tax=Streptomyces akebiae TaxID=2865673 RepID=UPI002175A944|nr:phage Gp37/Gp68 family protein [Streptomyces akebiae]
METFPCSQPLAEAGPVVVFVVAVEDRTLPVPSLELSRIDWVIVGGESGPAHRELDSAWVLDIRDQCVALRVALFFKQVGGLTPKAGGRLLEEGAVVPDVRS